MPLPSKLKVVLDRPVVALFKRGDSSLQSAQKASQTMLPPSVTQPTIDAVDLLEPNLNGVLSIRVQLTARRLPPSTHCALCAPVHLVRHVRSRAIT